MKCTVALEIVLPILCGTILKFTSISKLESFQRKTKQTFKQFLLTSLRNILIPIRSAIINVFFPKDI